MICICWYIILLHIDLNPLGGALTASVAVEQGETDFRTQIATVVEDGPEAIYIIAYEESIILLRQIRELGVSTQILGTVMMDNQDIISQAGSAAEGAIFVSWSMDLEHGTDETRLFFNGFKVSPPPYGWKLGSAMKTCTGHFWQLLSALPEMAGRNMGSAEKKHQSLL